MIFKRFDLISLNSILNSMLQKYLRRCSFCICWTQFGLGDTGNNPFYSREAFQGANVERSDHCLHSCRRVLLPVALIGYYTFGNNVEDNILISLEKLVCLIAMANMFVVIHVVGSYQIYAIPLFDMIETVMVKKLHFRQTRIFRFVLRNLYVAATMFVAITFNSLVVFSDSSEDLPLHQEPIFFIASCGWLSTNPRSLAYHGVTNWSCILYGSLTALNHAMVIFSYREYGASVVIRFLHIWWIRTTIDALPWFETVHLT